MTRCGSFTYTVRDGAGAVSNAATVTVSVTADSPVTVKVARFSWRTFNYLKFEVTRLQAAVTSAKLRVYVQTGSGETATAYRASNSYAGTTTPWTETGLTWQNGDRTGTALGTAALAAGAWIEVDVTAAVTGRGTFLALLNAPNLLGVLSSREGVSPPQLAVTAQPWGR